MSYVAGYPSITPEYMPQDARTGGDIQAVYIQCCESCFNFHSIFQDAFQRI